MKRICLGFIFVVGLSVYCQAQTPVFQSPYKDGHPFPENLKDHSPPVPVNLLDGGAYKKSAAKPEPNKTLKATSGQATKNEKIIPTRTAVLKNKKTSDKNGADK